MYPNAIKSLVFLVLCGIVAVLVGNLIGQGDYGSLLMLSYATLALFVFLAPGYLPLLALGLLNPFVLPIPFVFRFPFLILMIGICLIKLVFRNALTHTEFRPYRSCLTVWFALVFGWVIMRYLLKPVLPNLSGIGQHITGFRSYLNYAICLCIVGLVPLFIKKREDMLTMVKWMAWLSCGFILLFIPFVFSKSFTLALWLTRLGVFVTQFDNGWLRFVALPGFGITLITILMIPNLWRVPRPLRIALGFLGLVAVLLGGTRSGLLMTIVSVVSLLAIRLQFARLSVAVVTIAIVLLVFHSVGETAKVGTSFGILRPFALTSKRIATMTDAASTWEWRQVRWLRAIDEIKQNPWIGKGYGGLENAWLFGSYEDFGRASVDIDLAAGGAHNGFLASAHALGIPFVILFLAAFLHVIWRGGRQVFRLRNTDPLLSDLQSFIIANLVSFLVNIYVGVDLNTSTLWFFMALGILVSRLEETPKPVMVRAPAPPEAVLRGSMLGVR